MRRWNRAARRPGQVMQAQQVTVVTFWSGIAGDGPDGPLLFCTCAGIRGPDGRRTVFQRVWGWPDITAARAGHDAVTGWTGQVAAFLAGHASRLPAPGPPLPRSR